MDISERAAQILRRAEAELRGLVSDAAKSGDYAVVVQVASYARTVNELVRTAFPHERVAHPEAPVARTIKKTGNAAPRRRRITQSVTHAMYPRFFRRGDQLIRVAWSRRVKKEYQHRAPYAALKSLAAALHEKGADGRLLSTDQLLPIHDSDGTAIPSYQVYVGLALLKQTGLIDQHGRQGYSIPRIAEFKNGIEAMWRTLPAQ